MRRLLRSRFFIIALVIVVILTLAVASSKEGSGIKAIGNVISVPIAPLQSVISFMAERIGGVFDYFKDVKITKAENEELLRRINELKKENRELEHSRGKQGTQGCATSWIRWNPSSLSAVP